MSKQGNRSDLYPNTGIVLPQTFKPIKFYENKQGVLWAVESFQDAFRGTAINVYGTPSRDFTQQDLDAMTEGIFTPLRFSDVVDTPASISK